MISRDIASNLYARLDQGKARGARIRFPRTFTEAYPESETGVVSRERLDEFLLVDQG